MGKKIYWGAANNNNNAYCDVDRNWSDPTTAVINSDSFDPFEKDSSPKKECDLICLWNRDNNFEALKTRRD